MFHSKTASGWIHNPIEGFRPTRRGGLVLNLKQNRLNVIYLDENRSSVLSHIPTQYPISAGRNLAHKKKTTQWAPTAMLYG